MVPQTEVLKRKRSRPSDWWVNASIIASTPPRLPLPPPPPAQDEPEPGPAKKRGRRSTVVLGERAISDSPAAANRGRPAKKHRGTIDVEDENAVEDDSAKDKPAKVTRSSKTAGPSNDVQSKKAKKDGRGDKSAKEQGTNAPKRRGRPPASALNEDEEAEGPTEKQSRRTRRAGAEDVAESSGDEDIVGRRPAVATTREEPEEPVAPAPTRRRTRRSDAEQLVQDPRPLPRDDEPERGRPRTRRSDASINKEQATQPVQTQEERVRKRARVSDVPSQPIQDSSAMKNRPKRGRKQSRGAETTTVEVETASSKLTKAPNKSKKVDRTAQSKSVKGQSSSQTKSKSQPSKSSVQDAAGSKSSQARRKSSKRTSEPQPARKRKDVENPESTPKKRRRLTVEARQEEVAAPESPEPDMLYQYLRPIQRKVSRQIINSKWEALTPACIEPISQFLQDVQRPVVARLNDEKKKTQASTALQMVSRRLVSKLSKGLPFPQATRSRREDDFDFEKILDHNRALEAQLTPALHGNALLEAELAKETAWLEADKEALAQLERNAKGEAATRNKASRKMHALLQSDESLLEAEVSEDDIGMEDNKQHGLPLDLRVQDDEALQGLIKGLHGHVDTIKGNMKQVDGISEAIVNSKAAVQATLYSHLGGMQYQEVILGTD